MKQLFASINTGKPNRTGITRRSDTLDNVPKQFARSVSEWETTPQGYSESKRLLAMFGIEKQTSSPQAWWELAIISNAPLADFNPTIYAVKTHVQRLALEQTDEYEPIPNTATKLMEKNVEISDMCFHCNGIGHTNNTCGATSTCTSTVLSGWTGFKFEPYWNSLGLSQVDQERLAIGRWSTYIPFNEPSNGDKLIAAQNSSFSNSQWSL